MTDQALPRTARTRLALPGLLLLVALCSACTSVNYYGQAIGGQLSLLGKRQPLQTLINDPATDEALRARLHAVEDIRRFARETLGLDVGKAYSSYVETGQDAIVWNVFAAPVYSVNARQWCYPLIGCASYRGYFSQQAALDYAERLNRKGFDTWVSGVRAYSTLGWFADPVLDTFLGDDETALAALLFHELAHRLLYVKGDTTFNESFATSIEHYALGLWLHHNAGLATSTNALALHQQRLEDELAFVALVSEHRERLARFYASADEALLATGKAEQLEQLASAIERFAQSSPSRANYRHWAKSLNNARLAPVQSYYGELPAMRARLARLSGDKCPTIDGATSQCPAALSAYIEEMQVLAKQSQSERSARLAHWRMKEGRMEE